jgi:hypothetical protein
MKEKGRCEKYATKRATKHAWHAHICTRACCSIRSDAICRVEDLQLPLRSLFSFFHHPSEYFPPPSYYNGRTQHRQPSRECVSPYISLLDASQIDRYFADYKNPKLKQDELRRRREEQQVEIRRQKREENIAKRRNFIAADGPDSDDESTGAAWDTPVRVLPYPLLRATPSMLILCALALPGDDRRRVLRRSGASTRLDNKVSQATLQGEKPADREGHRMRRRPPLCRIFEARQLDAPGNVPRCHPVRD